MNASRRKVIASIVSDVSALQERIDEMLQEEQGILDNMPEGLQSSERGEKVQEAIDNLQSAYDGLDEISSSLESAAAV